MRAGLVCVQKTQTAQSHSCNPHIIRHGSTNTHMMCLLSEIHCDRRYIPKGFGQLIFSVIALKTCCAISFVAQFGSVVLHEEVPLTRRKSRLFPLSYFPIQFLLLAVQKVVVLVEMLSQVGPQEFRPLDFCANCCRFHLVFESYCCFACFFFGNREVTEYFAVGEEFSYHKL